jgi:uncharacterized protein
MPVRISCCGHRPSNFAKHVRLFSLMKISLAAETKTVIGVVADTHSNPHLLSLRYVKSLKPNLILHGGDIGDLSVLDTLNKIAPTYAVRGNIDEKTPGLVDEQLLTFTENDKPVFKIYMTHIAVYGPKLRKEVAAKARDFGASLVVCGHSHVPFIGQDKGLRHGSPAAHSLEPAKPASTLTMFNPGSIGPRRFNLPICFGVIEISKSGVKLRHINGETGDTWLPNL